MPTGGMSARGCGFSTTLLELVAMKILSCQDFCLEPTPAAEPAHVEISIFPLRN